MTHTTTGKNTCPVRLRTCIATRVKVHDTHLLRIVQDPTTPGVIIPDPDRNKPGRGAWITPSAQALALAEKKRAIARALKVSAPVDTAPVHEWIAGISQHDPHGECIPSSNSEKDDRPLMSTR